MWNSITITFVIGALIAWSIIVYAIAEYRSEFSFLTKSGLANLPAKLYLLLPLTIVGGAILGTGYNISDGPDWQAYYMYHEVVRNALLEGALPDWSTSLSGGYPFAAHPESPSISFFTLPVLLFGVVFGLKINIALMYFLLSIGTFLLCRRYVNLTELSASAVSGLVLASLLLAARISSHKYTNMFEYLIPLIIVLVLDIGTNRRFKDSWIKIVGAALLIAAVFYQGKIGFISMVMVLVPVILVYLLRNWGNRSQFFLHLISIAGLSFIFVLPKFLPMIDLLVIDNRLVPDWGLLKYHVFDAPTLGKAIGSYRLSPEDWIRNNQMIGVGVLPLLLAGYATIRQPLKALPWLIGAGIFMLIGLGESGPIPLGYWLWHLPLWHSMEDLDKYVGFFIMISIAVLAGLGLDGVRNFRSPFQMIIFFIFGTYVGVLAVTSALHQMDEFGNRISKVAYSHNSFLLAEFKKGVVLNKYCHSDWLCMKFNVGAVKSYVNLHIPGAVQPEVYIDQEGNMEKNISFRGSAFSESGQGTVIIERRFQTGFRLAVSIQGPEVIVINQNNDGNWHTNFGTMVKDESGLVKIQLDQRGAYDLKVFHHNWPYLISTILAFIALIISGIGVLFIRNRHNIKSFEKEVA